MIITEAETAKTVIPDPTLHSLAKHFDGTEQRMIDIGQQRPPNPTESHRVAAADSTTGPVLKNALKASEEIDTSHKSVADNSQSSSDTLQTTSVTSAQSRKRKGTANIRNTLRIQTMHSTSENDRDSSLYNNNGGKRARSDTDEEPPAKNGKPSTTRSLPAAQKNPASVARRNARERRRIKNVNLAFDELREHVPSGEKNKKKISKVDTLQSAIEYIKALESLVKRRRGRNEKRRQDYENEENNPRASVDDVSYPNSVASVLSSYPNDDDPTCSTTSNVSPGYNNGKGNQCQDDDVVFVSSNTLPPVQERAVSVDNAPTGISHNASPMLEDFSALVNERKRQAENIPNLEEDSGETQHRENDIRHYMDFGCKQYDGNDSGYSDDSASSNCEQNSQSYLPFRPSEQPVTGTERNHDDLEQILFAPTSAECVQSQTGNSQERGQGFPAFSHHNSNHSAFKEVSVEDIQTFLRSCSSYPSHVESEVISQHQFQYSQRYPASVITYPEHSLNYTSEQENTDMMNNGTAQHSPPAFASTPIMHKNPANEGPAFVFPPYANSWNVPTTERSRTINGIGGPPDADVNRITENNFEGYRFGDTLD